MERGFELRYTSVDRGSMDDLLAGRGSCHLSKSSDGDLAEGNDVSEAVLRYINEVLMEDDLENDTCMILESTLDAAEKSFYDVLNNNNVTCLPDEALNLRDSNSSSCTTRMDADNIAQGSEIGDQWKYKFWFSEQTERTKHNLLGGNSWNSVPCEAMEKVCQLPVEAENGYGDFPSKILSRGRKDLHQEEGDLGEGSKTHLALCAQEPLLGELFEKAMVLCDGNDGSVVDLHLDGQAKGCIGGEIYSKKQVSKREAVDLRGLLLQCMQYLSENDHENATKLLKQIRRRSSPSGDGSQRLVHCFANGLEARLQANNNLVNKNLLPFTGLNASISDSFKAYKLFLTAFPLFKTSNYVATEKIVELAGKASAVHIIQFGIAHGLQLAPMIQRLSTRPGGPPMLRVTGIDFPQYGLHPAARIRETGRRLQNYCEKHKVSLEYNGMAQNWETLSLEDLKIRKGQVLVVMCFYQMHYLLDDTILEDSPRDAVLNLIKRINPDIFIHGTVNATHNSPFLISRFREALFHFTTLFDMFDAIVPRNNQDRMVYEEEWYGRQVLNIIACEGLERIERPETYKQWQVRTVRAGFRQLPLNHEITKKVRALVKSCNHKHFFVDESSQWMVQGWKGRAIIALSFWRPA